MFTVTVFVGHHKRVTKTSVERTETFLVRGQARGEKEGRSRRSPSVFLSHNPLCTSLPILQLLLVSLALRPKIPWYGHERDERHDRCDDSSVTTTTCPVSYRIYPFLLSYRLGDVLLVVTFSINCYCLI